MIAQNYAGNATVCGYFVQVKSICLACAHKCDTVVKEDPATSKIFKEKVDAFMTKASADLTNGKEQLLEAKHKFKEVMRFYQFIPKGATIETAEPHDFFNLWLGFCRDFKV